MKVHLVHAHPEPTSFNASLRDLARETLIDRGHEVTCTDLYAQNFNAVPSRADFTTIADQDVFKLQIEQRLASTTGGFSSEVANEQELLLGADLLLLQFPLWWFGFPAILKGWVDRVLAYGVAYGGGMWFDQGPLRGKRVLVSMTTGGRSDRFAEDGLFGEFGTVEKILRPIEVGIFNFVGLDVLEPFVVHGPTQMADDERQFELQRYRTRLTDIENEAVRPFHSIPEALVGIKHGGFGPNAAAARNGSA